MKTEVSMLRVACHHPCGKYIASPGLMVHSRRFTSFLTLS